MKLKEFMDSFVDITEVNMFFKKNTATFAVYIDTFDKKNYIGFCTRYSGDLSKYFDSKIKQYTVELEQCPRLDVYHFYITLKKEEN